MTSRLKTFLGSLLFRIRGGETLVAIPDETPDPQPRGLRYQCLHPPGCWSYCTGGYRYCLCCNRVRVRC